jgi:hypothetical protein
MNRYHCDRYEHRIESKCHHLDSRLLYKAISLVINISVFGGGAVLKHFHPLTRYALWPI